jgi:hypothetical protein
MNSALRAAYDAELLAARRAAAGRNTEQAFQHLARAHILSQRFTWRHVQVHWLMLQLGATVGDSREVFGQMSRIVAATVFSRIWVPAGNTGRANVSAVQPMPIPDDLRALLEANGA